MLYVRGNQQDCVIGPAGGGAVLGSLEGKGGWKRGFGGAAPMETKISQFSYPCGNALPHAPIGCLATREVQLSRNMSHHLLTTPPPLSPPPPRFTKASPPYTYLIASSYSHTFN